MLDRVKGFGELTLKGLVATNAPSIFKGLINEMLRQRGFTVDLVILMIEGDKSMWSEIPPQYHDKVKKIMQQIGNLDWLTTEWFIDAIKKDHPALASLFLSPWRKARRWLDRQIEEIKREVSE